MILRVYGSGILPILRKITSKDPPSIYSMKTFTSPSLQIRKEINQSGTAEHGGYLPTQFQRHKMRMLPKGVGNVYSKQDIRLRIREKGN